MGRHVPIVANIRFANLCLRSHRPSKHIIQRHPAGMDILT